ncbi:hypothetical protein [Chromatium okenii]|uniref:Uncharacterized protein n=1 Tax=Chromatium okenii TaxID=61644 RepID=A0A2S7XVF8_9GAMM|nr:hypothetical protein [Chromatium okenii]PQJ97533.1 hypothetical protein CXB77_01260 [Chromatium okenii]
MFEFRKKGKAPDSSVVVSTRPEPADAAPETAESDSWFGKKWFKSKAETEPAAEIAPPAYYGTAPAARCTKP